MYPFCSITSSDPGFVTTFVKVPGPQVFLLAVGVVLLSTGSSGEGVVEFPTLWPGLGIITGLRSGVGTRANFEVVSGGVGYFPR